MNTPRLVAELVPASTWGFNLRSLLSPEGWDLLRQREYVRAGFVCEVCGGKGRKHPIECHERWAYNDHRHIQKLIGLEGLCPPCHSVRHLGRSLAIGQGPQVKRHLAKVNQWTPAQVDTHVENALRQWDKRSRFPWKLDVSWLDSLPPEFRARIL